MCPIPRWLRRVGLVGLGFFLVKGLIWIAVAAFSVAAVVN